MYIQIIKKFIFAHYSSFRIHMTSIDLQRVTFNRSWMHQCQHFRARCTSCRPKKYHRHYHSFSRIAAAWKIPLGNAPNHDSHNALHHDFSHPLLLLYQWVFLVSSLLNQCRGLLSRMWMIVCCMYPLKVCKLQYLFQSYHISVLLHHHIFFISHILLQTPYIFPDFG